MTQNTLLDTRTLEKYGLSNKAKYENQQSRLTIKRSGMVVTVIATQIDKVDVNLENYPRKRKTGKREIDTDMDVQTIIENMRRSMRRTYQAVLTKARLIGVDRMLTLTFKSNVTTIDNATEALHHFTRLARKKFGDFPYIATPERQKRGAWHFHLGLTKFYNWFTLLAIWRLAIKKAQIENGGGIYINKHVMVGKVNHVARYISKYILKGIKNIDVTKRADFFNKKRYYSSKINEKIEKVKVYSAYPPNHWYLNYILSNIISDLFNKKVQSSAFLGNLKDWLGRKMVFYEFEIFDF